MRKLAILTVALLAALSAGVLAVTAGSGSSHREAPLSALDPTGGRHRRLRLRGPRRSRVA